MQAVACDAHEHIFASTGALAFVNAYSGSAALPALYNACAERQQACPLAPLYHTRGDHTGSHKHPKHLRPLLASTGLIRNPMSASKPLALNSVSFCALNIVLKR